MNIVSRQHTGLIVALLTSTVLIANCTARPVNPDAVAAQRQALAQKVVHDFTTVVLTANRQGRLNDEASIIVLRIDQQVSDVIQANPQGWLEKASVIAQNAKQALPPALQAQVASFLDTLLGKLGEIK